MARFLFAPLPGAGHVNPMLPVAAELVRRGERVEFWLPPAFAGAAAATGATIHAEPEMAMPTPGPPVDLAAMLRGIRAVLRPPRSLVEAATAARADVGTVLVYDSFTGWGKRLGLPSVAFATTTVANGRTLASDLADLLGRGDQGRTVRARERLLRSRVPRTLDRIPMPMRTRGELTLVAVPREFQPWNEAFGPEVVFVGPCLGPRAGEDDDPVVARIADDDRPLVLVALGTAFNHRPDFYAACYRAFADTPWQVVLAAGERTDVAALGPPPPNVLVVPRVPQLQVLARASAFVSHGGMNSVMESLHHGVPLVLFPQQPEQRANADRVVAHGAGLRLPRKPSEVEIHAAVEHVLADDGIAAAVARLQAVVRSAGGQQLAADTLQTFARQQTAASSA